MVNKNCELNVKKLILFNPDKIHGLNIRWKYNPKTQELKIKAIKKNTPNHA